MKVNYEAKITKAKSWVNVWSRRDLTLMGKVTIIKSLIFSQFSYLAIPLIKPSCAMIKIIDKLTSNFLWGCKRAKIKRDVVRRRVNEEGLGLFDFLKLTLIKKVIDPNFAHYWKTIFIKQLKFSKNIEISIENTLTSNNCKIVQDVLLRYRECAPEVGASTILFGPMIKSLILGPGCGVRTSSLEVYFISQIFWLPIKA